MDSFARFPSGGWPIQDERVRRIPRKQAKLSMTRRGGLLVFQLHTQEVVQLLILDTEGGETLQDSFSGISKPMFATDDRFKMIF